MNWLNKLQRKIGKFYIRNLMLIIISGTVLVYGFTMLSGEFTLVNNISLVPSKVMQGEVWRLVTFIFVPQSFSIISFIFSMYFYYLAGTGLEHEWGEFKFNFYYFIGVIATIVVSMVTGATATGEFINLSLFLAFAKIYPNYQVLLFYIIPIKVKYLAIFNWVIIGYNFIFAESMAARILTLVPLINFFIFFGKDIVTGTKSGAVNYRRQQKFKSQVKEREIFHKCEICGVTEKDDPKMEFRYCSKCSGKKCYCENHIRNHEHK
ncbi:MAG: rhomboid family intramembrane serine protease [Clostridium sartagoforme]|nr:rhomboid family intramembrane serine protease [Clostridium sartagoforme]